jgi:excisionase family DNA binding protein
MTSDRPPDEPQAGQLLDAKGAAELLNVPASWVLEEARHDRVPHIKLGPRYVRFDREQLLAWVRHRARGPVYDSQTANSGPGDVGAPRGLTPKE